ncbi:MAG: hypothetical protein HY537_00460 [Deltaproteobacteria bacterium]|nr:hypothetical protein [Deltaproteobacteria bacterium]
MGYLTFKEEDSRFSRDSNRRPRVDGGWIIAIAIVWLCLFAWIFLIGHKKDYSPGTPSIYTPIDFVGRY